MAFAAVATIGSSIIGGLISSDAQSNAADTAANAQIQASGAQIGEMRRQFDAVQALLKPYADAGTGALAGQQNLLGLNGNSAQQDAYTNLEDSPAFKSMTQVGENAILQNASATGNLRGGNVEAALAQFRPALLAQLINSQYAKLGGLTSVGQNAAAGTGNAGMATGSAVSDALAQAGAATAGNALAQGRITANNWGNISGAIGQFGAQGGFKNFGNLNFGGQVPEALPGQFSLSDPAYG